MCGICGIVNTGKGTAPDPAIVRAMMGRLKHRGPDGSGYYRDAACALGHTRLSIIDLLGGTQPMSNEDGAVWLTFNGEIYNYVELGRELRELGHVFKTQSDSEIIIHAYEEWGTGCFTRMNGQWAVGIWDARRKELVLSRDRLGIRPLYYTVHGNRLLFASEVKAIFADRSVPRRPDAEGLKEILTFWSPIAPRTAFSGIRQLKPGHYAVVRAGQRTTGRTDIDSRPYWSPEFAPSAGTGSAAEAAESANAEALRERLVDAARLRFTRSDVSVGAYLSGGIDSSITSAIINAYTDAPLKTFSIRFEDSEFDETNYQKLMADRLGTDHQGTVVSQAQIGRVFPDVIRHVERPILRTAPAPLFLLSGLVRDAGYKVVVTGEGADEVLAGYDIFREGKTREFIARDPSSNLRPEILTKLYPWMERSPAQVPAFAKAFFGRNVSLDDSAISHRPRWDATSALQHMVEPELFGSLNGTDVVGDLLAAMPGSAADWDSLGRAQWLEMTTLLEGYILSAQGDRMLMAHSVEGRFPFLDPALVDFAGTLPARHKLMGLDEKHILKTACNDLIPPEIAARPKQPYRAPDGASFFGPHAPDYVSDLLWDGRVREAGIFQPAIVDRLKKKVERRGAAALSNTDNMRVVAVVSAMLWHDQFIDGSYVASDASEPPEPMTVVDRLA